MKKLSSRTVSELKMIARESGIDLPHNALKADIVAAIEASGNSVVTANTESPNLKPTVQQNSDGVIGSATSKEMPKVTKKESPVSNGKVAVFSERNLSWNGVGKLNSGYNFVGKEDAQKWIRQRGVRLATPEEVSAHCGVS